MRMMPDGAFFLTLVVASGGQPNRLGRKNGLCSLRLSLCITTYNNPAMLGRVLRGVARQTSLPEEVIICDDGSGPETRALVARKAEGFPVPLRHAWEPDAGWRVSRTRNNGILAAACPYLVFIDGDCVPHRRFIADHRRLAEPNCFIAGDRAHVHEAWVGRFDPTLPKVVYYLITKRLHKRRNALRVPWEKPLRFDRGSVDPDWMLQNVIGTNMAFWKEDAMRVNGFDETLEMWGPEDGEFLARLLNNGVKAKKHRRLAVTYHLDHPSSLNTGSPWYGLFHERFRERAVWAGQGIDRHGGRARLHPEETAGGSQP